jgi:cytochrome c oxidase subunit IV
MDQRYESAPDQIEKDLRANPEKGAPAMEFRTYVFVWLGIIALTAITFTLSRTKVGGWEVFIALLIAGTQAALALYFFMHLRDEKIRIFKIIIPLVLAILVVFMALIFSDVAFRG